MTGVALIGTGAIAAVQADAYAQFPDRCRIRTLCDIYPEKAEAFAREKELHEVEIISDYKQAIDRSDIDLLLWMLGKPEKVHADFTNLNHSNSETEDFSTALLVYADGSVSQLNASLVHHGEEQEMIMQAEKARFSVPWEVTASTSLENGFPQNDPRTEELLFKLYESVSACIHEGHAAQIENVLSALESDVELLVDGVAGRRTLELILGICKSAYSRTMVDLPLAESDPFYRSETMITVVPRFHEKSISKTNFEPASINLGRKL
jgi:predicted dehydrogenase